MKSSIQLKKNRKNILFFILGGSGLSLVIFGFFLWMVSESLPKILKIEDYEPRVVTQVYAEKNDRKDLIAEFYKERRYVVPFESIPPLTVKAFLAAEDDRFYDHQGISIAAILRASLANMKAGHVVQGGSTITQQVAKTLFLSSERKMMRKIKEAILAYRLENHLTKDQILYLYLNQIYLGHGAYGLEAAARSYFQKNVSQLTLAESALLAGLVKGPGKFTPLIRPKRAKERQRYVLGRMLANQFITQQQYDQALNEKIRIYEIKDLNKSVGGYYAEQVRRYLVEKYGDQVVYEQGLVVKVPTSLELIQTARKSVKEGLIRVSKRRGFRGPLRRVETQEELNQFIENQRNTLLKEKIGFELFMPDGKMDLFSAQEELGLSRDEDLIEIGKTYEGYVTKIDDGKKRAIIIIGSVEIVMDFDDMKWAHPYAEDPKAVMRAPDRPSQVLNKGDIVLVKIIPFKKNYKFEKEENFQFFARLEQEPKEEGALFSIENDTGFVLAMEGGYDFNRSEFNRAVQAKRQPGSAFKPLIYSAGIEAGFTPASIIVDSPIVYDDGDFGTWKPANFEHRFYGDTTYRQAFINSRNIPTIKLVQKLTIPRVIDYARRLGFSGHLAEDLSISLGSGLTNLSELVPIYATFPRYGRKVRPIFVREVKNREGELMEENLPTPLPPIAQMIAPVVSNEDEALEKPKSSLSLPRYPPESDPDQVLDPRVAYVTIRMMRDVVEFGTGRGAKTLGRPAGGKTGTTNDYKDAWFMGYTPNLTTGAWVGYDDQSQSMYRGETGGRTALPIWFQFMKVAVKDYPEKEFEVPDGVIHASVDIKNGRLVPQNTPHSYDAAFISGTEPTEVYDKSQGQNIDTDSEFFKEEFE